MNDGDPIKSNATQNESASIPDTTAGSERVNPLPRAGDIAVDQTAQSGQKTGEADKPKQPSQQDILDRIRAGELWMIIFTAVVALTTVAQFVQSGCNNRSTSKQVDKIIASTNTQANAADEISGAAGDFTDNAYWMQEQMKDAADAIQDSVDTADRNMKTTIKNAQDAFRDEQRAWVGVQGTTLGEGFTETEPWRITVVFFNSGRTPARNVQTSIMFITSPIPISGPSPDQVEQLTFRPAQSIAPQGYYRQAIGGEFVAEASSETERQGTKTLISQYNFIKNKQLFLYYFGILKYDDIFGNRRTTQFCIGLTKPDTKEAGMCDAFNDLN